MIKSFRRANIHFKSDERVLGDSDFVERVLKAADEFIERKYQLKSQGYDIDKIADRVAEIFSIKPEEIFHPGKQPVKVKARSLFCYWTVMELGVYNGGSGSKAQYFAAGGQYECSAWRANSIRKWIFIDV